MALNNNPERTNRGHKYAVQRQHEADITDYQYENIKEWVEANNNKVGWEEIAVALFHGLFEKYKLESIRRQ